MKVERINLVLLFVGLLSVLAVSQGNFFINTYQYFYYTVITLFYALIAMLSQLL